MKKVFNRGLILVVILLLVNLSKIEAIKFNINEKNLEIYEIKEKDKIFLNTNIIEFYEKNLDNTPFETNSEVLVEEEVVDLTLQEEIINFALNFLGNPYVGGGTSLTTGADCSGFIQAIFASYGISVPRTTYDQSISGTSVSIENIRIGDIISYGYEGYPTHSALYIGNNTIIHSSTPELGVRLDNIYIMPIIDIRRVI